MTTSTSPFRGTTILLLLLVVIVGSALRLTRLEPATMGGDVMEFYKIAQSGIRPSELLIHSPNYIGRLPPFWFAVHNGIIQSLRMEVNFRTVRLPDAITGILAILAAFGAGCATGDRRVGLMGALIIAIQPLHAQMSRECYFYVPIVLGGFLATWALLRLANRDCLSAPPNTLFYALAIPGFLLLTNVQISSWLFAAAWVLALYALLLPRVFRGKLPWWHIGILSGLLFLFGLPTLLSEWGMRDALSVMFGDNKDYWSNVFGEKHNLWTSAGHIATAYLVGRGGVRSAASTALLVLCVIGWIAKRNSSAPVRSLGWFSLVTLILYALSHMKSIFPAESRHYASLTPILTIGCSLGLVWVSDFLAARLKLSPPAAGLPLAVFTLLLVALLAPPAWMVTRIVGSPPFRQVSEWADRHLPPGTPVLCDRWFNPWNEFRVNPSTNVLYTFTVPSEPVQVYASSRWRETAKEFFAINPLAAYFEQKTYWTRLGPWTWPHSQFARQQEFADPVADRLDRMGLFYRSVGPDYPREWIPVTLFYNTENDLVERAAKAGDRILCLFGTGWTYTKTQDYRDWYLLRDEASLVLHNLTASPMTATVNLTGVAVEGSVTLSGPSGPPAVFPPNQILARSIGPVSLAPGRNEISLSIRSGSPPGAALLVQRTSAKEISPPPP